MSHPSACGVSADDVAVLVHDDLLAIGQGHGIAAIADALETAARDGDVNHGVSQKCL